MLRHQFYFVAYSRATMDLAIDRIIKSSKNSRIAHESYCNCRTNHTRARLEYKIASRNLLDVFKTGQDFNEAFQHTIECGKNLDNAEKRLSQARNRLNQAYVLEQNAIKALNTILHYSQL